jgi:hypothetical protein
VPGGPKAHRKTQAGISRKPGPEFPRISGRNLASNSSWLRLLCSPSSRFKPTKSRTRPGNFAVEVGRVFCTHSDAAVMPKRKPKEASSQCGRRRHHDDCTCWPSEPSVEVGKAQAPKFFTGRLPAIEMPRARAGSTRSLRPRARPGSESLRLPVAGPARGLRTVLVRWYY